VTGGPSIPASYPPAARLDLVERRHGVAIADPYRWLENASDPRTVAWMRAQDELFGAVAAGWPGRERWRAEVTRLRETGWLSPPLVRGGRTFFACHEAGSEHPVVRVTENGATRVLVDPLAWDPDGKVVLEAWQPSVEGDLLAFQLSANGTEDCLLRVLDVRTGQVVDGPVDRVRRSPVAWLPGGQRFYYVRRLPPELNPGEERYHRRVFLHRVGSDPGHDVNVFGDGRDKTQFYTVSVTQDGRWVTISATRGTAPAVESWLADLSAGRPEQPGWRKVHQHAPARTRLHVAPGCGPDDPVWLRTDRHAPRGRVMVASPAHLGEDDWRDLIGERPSAVLTGLAVLGGPAIGRRLGLVSWTRHAVSELTVHDLVDGKECARVPLPGTGSVGSLVVQPADGHVAWFHYTDHFTPMTVLRYDASTGTLTRWPDEGDRVSPPDVTVRRMTARSKDGTPVRGFVISGSGDPDRPRPAIVTGYGGFGVSNSPSYSPMALAWVRAGGVFAVACPRGGGEEGREWHLTGRGPHKQNTFDDFDAFASHLVHAGWTSHSRLGILGGSNGGLLVGAALTQHPEKYAAAVCVSPLLDMARYELTGLGPSWVPEYGTAEDPGQLRTLLSYSPYHRVAAGTDYPAVLFLVAGGDTRVDPLHARKMCAALQHASRGPGPVLLGVEQGVGHGARAVSRQVAQDGDCLAFFGAHLGLEPQGERA
jgi:prolyl oligopeptidase